MHAAAVPGQQWAARLNQGHPSNMRCIGALDTVLGDPDCTVLCLFLIMHVTIIHDSTVCARTTIGSIHWIQ